MCNAAVTASLTPCVLYDTVSVDPGANIDGSALNNLTPTVSLLPGDMTEKEDRYIEKYSQVTLNQIEHYG